jgi:hypothetical protein
MIINAQPKRFLRFSTVQHTGLRRTDQDACLVKEEKPRGRLGVNWMGRVILGANIFSDDVVE